MWCVVHFCIGSDYTYLQYKFLINVKKLKLYILYIELL